MNFLKKLTNKIILNTVLIILLLSIILNNIKNYQYNYFDPYIVQINNEGITNKQINYIYKITREQQKKELGNTFHNIINTKTFKKKTYKKILKNLIDEILLKQYANQLGFIVQEKKINYIIAHLPYFQENGKFNYKIYLHKLNKIGITSYQYKNNLKMYKIKDIIIKKLSNSEFILKYEKQLFFKMLSEKRIVKKSYINTFNLMHNQTINNKEINKYYEKYHNLFSSPIQYKIDYVPIQTNKIPILIDPKEIRHWYITHIQDYINPINKNYSIIQTNNLKESKNILNQLKNNQLFHKLAKYKSIDPISSLIGGNIGWLNNSECNKEIKKINLTKIDQISPIIKFQFGYIIFKLNSITLSTIRSLSEVQNEIIKNIKKQKIILKKKYIYQKIINHHYFSSILLKKIANNINAKLITTNWFTKYTIPNLIQKNEIIQYIFNISNINCKKYIKTYSKWIKINDNISYIIKITIRKNNSSIQFHNIQNKIKSILKYQYARKTALQIAKKKIIEFNKNNKIVNNKKSIFKKSIIISRNNQQSISKLVFQLPYPKKEKKQLTLQEENNGNITILYLYKVINIKLNNEEKKIITNYLLQCQIESILTNLTNNLRKKANIQYKKNNLF
ncbi:Periplasmic chaperone PpiD [Buchnera aphidicola (Eriosoma lanigerum)]|uniref:SurA N-terminal domain-containing protein n=1 Tax=Buchnera aphidicola TaxID=9 RepID=UPI0034639C26